MLGCLLADELTPVLEQLPTIVACVCAVFLVIAFFVGFAKGGRKVSWSGLVWLGASLAFILIEKYAFAESNPLDALFEPLAAGFGLEAAQTAVLVSFMSSFALALCCILVALLLYGIFSLALRPHYVRKRRVSDRDLRDADGVEYDEEYADYDDYELAKPRRTVLRKGFGRPSFFGRLLGGLICAINTALVLAVVLAVALFMFHNTPLKDGPLCVLYENEYVNLMVQFASDYALDMLFMGIVIAFACKGNKKGFLESLRGLIVGLGSLVAVGACFYIPFSPLALPREEGGDYFISEFVKRCMEATNALFGGGLPEVTPIIGQILAGLILAVFVIIAMIVINIILKKLVELVDRVSFFRAIDGALAGLIYMVIGVIVAAALWAVWYVLTYYGIFYADALFTSQSSISTGVFQVFDIYLKPLILSLEETIAGLIAGFGGGTGA